MSQRHFVYEEESKKLCGLKIKNAKEDDSGVYAVVIDNLYGTDDSTAQVVVILPNDGRIRQRNGSNTALQQPACEKLLPPRVGTNLVPEQTVMEGEPIVLNAIIEGLPLPLLSFYKNDVPLAASARVRTSYDPNTGIVSLRIEDSNVNDAGAYKIIAENICGRVETSGAVYVGKQPVIEAPPLERPVQAPEPVVEQQPELINDIAPNFINGLPPNYKLKEGESIKLTCQVEGLPRPIVSWLKDGKALPQSLRFNTSYIVPTGVASLTVTGCLLNDCGNYTAVAENPAGKAYTTSQVFVKEPHGADHSHPANIDSQTDDDVPLNRAKAPKVIHGLVNQKLPEGQTVVMACKIDGFPKPNVISFLFSHLFIKSIKFYF